MTPVLVLAQLFKMEALTLVNPWARVLAQPDTGRKPVQSMLRFLDYSMEARLIRASSNCVGPVERTVRYRAFSSFSLRRLLMLLAGSRSPQVWFDD